VNTATLSDSALQGLVDEIAPTLPLHPLYRKDVEAHRRLDAVWDELHRRGWQRHTAPTTTPGVFTLAWVNIKEVQ
jgi:hypothetical protein